MNESCSNNAAECRIGLPAPTSVDAAICRGNHGKCIVNALLPQRIHGYISKCQARKWLLAADCWLHYTLLHVKNQQQHAVACSICGCAQYAAREGRCPVCQLAASGSSHAHASLLFVLASPQTRMPHQYMSWSPLCRKQSSRKHPELLASRWRNCTASGKAIGCWGCWWPWG